MQHLTIGFLCLALLAATSCCSVSESGQATPDKKTVLISAIVMKAGSDGNQMETEPKASWITDAQALADLYRGINRNTLGAEILPPTLDLSKEGVLFISMGSRATAGYQVTLASTSVIVKNGIAEIKVAWLEPEPGAITAQVLTSPYLVLQLPRAGVKRIRVLDQNHTIRAEITTK